MLGCKRVSQVQKKILVLLFTLFLLTAACTSSKTRMANDKTVRKGDIVENGDSKTLPSALLENWELFSVGENEVDLFWRTSEATSTSLSYAEDKDNLKTVRIKNRQKNHYLRIRHLKPETTYYYRINGVRDARVEQFRTLAKPDRRYIFSFAVCTDMHLTNSKLDQFGALYKESWDIFNTLINEVNKENVDFLVVKGDITHDSEAVDYQAFTEAVSRLNCKTYVVPGNHDKEKAGWGLFFRSFSPNSSSYFSLNHKKWHFVFLDSALEKLDKGYLSSDELSWLKRDLEANSSTPTMIFMHHLARKTPFSQGERFFIENSEEFLKTIDPYPVVAVHSGHAHLNNVSSFRGTEFIVTGAVINYPTQYNVYRVYEKGYVQVSHRLPSHLDQSEASKHAITAIYSARLGVKPGLVSSLVEGTLEDRSFMRRIK